MNLDRQYSVVGIGEVLWDLLLTGRQLGGAPANFAYHAHALGAKAVVITRVGNDEDGREIIRRFGGMHVSDSGVQVDDTSPTGTVKVQLSGDGLAHFTVQEKVAWDNIAVTPQGIKIANEGDAICFGSLAQRSNPSRRTIQQLVSATQKAGLRVFDINLRQDFYSRDVIKESLKLANVLKMNDDELPVLARMFALTGSTENKIESLSHTFNLGLVALTRGANGSLLFQRSDDKRGDDSESASGESDAERANDRWSDFPSRPVTVVDTVGAGDSFTAALVLGMLRKIDLDEINRIANDVARYVCSQAGATPPLPPEFAKRFLTAA